MKKVRTVAVFLFLIIIVAIGIFYIQMSLRKASAPPAPSRTPSLDAAPVRLYGLVEPLGREVFVGPTKARRVERIFVQEGQNVSVGQTLCVLEQAVERQALEVARLRVKEFEGRLNLILDELNRKKPLSQNGAISEVEYTQKSLEAELIRRQIKTYQAEVELRKRELDMLTLRSPIQGRLYKFDVRIGEQLTPQDYKRIVIGKPEKQVRLFVESFWLDKIQLGDVFQVRDADNMRNVGFGKIVAVSEYVGARNFRSEDTFERLDTKYAQAILQVEGAASVPLGKLVLCVRKNSRTEKASPDAK